MDANVIERIRHICVKSGVATEVMGAICLAVRESLVESETQRPMPEGWKLVPVDPTLEMLEAAADAYDGSSFRERRMYKAMLEAAPECKATPSSYGGGASCEQRWHCEKCGDVTDAHHCPLGHASAHCPMIQSSDKPSSQIPPTPTNVGRIPELHGAERNAAYWIDGAKGEKNKVEALLCLHQAVNAWKNAAYAAWDQIYAARSAIEPINAEEWMREHLEVWRLIDEIKALRGGVAVSYAAGDDPVEKLTKGPAPILRSRQFLERSLEMILASKVRRSEGGKVGG